MREGWEVVKLGDVCQLLNGRAYKKPELLSEGKYPVLRVGNFFSNRNWYYSDLELDASKYCDDGDLLYAWSASFGPRIWSGGKVIYHYHIWKTELNEIRVNKKFLYYWFDWDAEKIQSEQGAGTTMVHVTKGAMEKRSLSLPPLAEQKRIVALLDEAFAGIAVALAAASKNLKNARELFETTLNTTFTQKGEGWVETTLGECFRLRSGDGLTSKAMVAGDFEVYGGNGVAGTHNRSNLSGENVIIGRVGALCGNARFISKDIWLTDNAFKVVDYKFEFGLHFLTYLLNFKNLRSLARQSAQPVISNSSLKDLMLEFPVSVVEQHRITLKLDALSQQTQALEALYQQKIDALNELKQSLLQKAFAGELTAEQEDAA